MAFTLVVSWDRGRRASGAARRLGAVAFTVALHVAVVGSLLLVIGGGSTVLVPSVRRLMILDVREAGATASPVTVSAQTAAPAQPRPTTVTDHSPPIAEWSVTTIRITRTIESPPPAAATSHSVAATPASVGSTATLAMGGGGFDPYAGSAPIYRAEAVRAPVALPPSAPAPAIPADAPDIKAALRSLAMAMPTAHGVALLAVRCESGRVADVYVRYGSLPVSAGERLAGLLRRSLSRDACAGRAGEVTLGPLQL